MLTRSKSTKMSATEDGNNLSLHDKSIPIKESHNDTASVTNVKDDVVFQPFNVSSVTVPTVDSFGKYPILIDKSPELHINLNVEDEIEILAAEKEMVNGNLEVKFVDSTIDVNNLNTPSLPQVLNKLNSLQKTVEDLSSERSNLYSDINRLKRKVIALNNYKEVINESFTAIEKELSLLAQYGKRESIEILGIPEFIGIENLEMEVIKILSSIGVYVDSYQIVAVHRLKETNTNNPRSTIVRFVNRKHAFLALFNKNNLRKTTGYQNVYIIENLCPLYKSLYQKCRKMKADKTINHLWTHNGIINIKFSDSRNEKPVQIMHEEDFDYYFNEEDKCQWTEDEDN